MRAAADKLKVSQSSINNWVQNAKSNDGIVEHRGSGNYSRDAEKEIARLKLRDKEDALDILEKIIGRLNNN